MVDGHRSGEGVDGQLESPFCTFWYSFRVCVAQSCKCVLRNGPLYAAMKDTLDITSSTASSISSSEQLISCILKMHLQYRYLFERSNRAEGGTSKVVAVIHQQSRALNGVKKAQGKLCCFGLRNLDLQDTPY